MSARSQRNKCLSQVTMDKCKKKDYCWQYGPFADACNKVLYVAPAMDVQLQKAKEELKQDRALTDAVAPNAESNNQGLKQQGNAAISAGVADLGKNKEELAAQNAAQNAPAAVDPNAMAAQQQASNKQKMLIIGGVVAVLLIGGILAMVSKGKGAAAPVAAPAGK